MILERIQLVLENPVWTHNIQETYVDKDDPWMGILSATTLKNRFSQNKLKCYTLGQFLFFHDMILLMKHNAGC